MRLRLLFSEAWRSLGANLSTTIAATMTVLVGMFLLLGARSRLFRSRRSLFLFDFGLIAQGDGCSLLAFAQIEFELVVIHRSCH